MPNQIVTSIFSGIGGFEVGFARAGLTTALMCERDASAQTVLRQHFPDTGLVNDVTTMSDLPACDVLVGGWPCQDLSQAGRMAGLDGDHSGLISHVFRLISATQLLIQRAALELDIAPEEFEPLEPRVRRGLPLLQVADFLVNGAGFSRRLADVEFGVPLATRLVESMVLNPRDVLTASYFADHHPTKCARSCYRCLQRYNNRGYHGLLDWRLGLSFLRCLLDGQWHAGLDGDWTSGRELSDWPRLACDSAEELRRMDPRRRTVERHGPLDLPVLRRQDGGRVEAFLIVHPFWRLDSPSLQQGSLGETLRLIRADEIYFVDTFEVARRPVRALDHARNRQPESF
jgi:C-5 cytosine-specific DNA methylase